MSIANVQKNATNRVGGTGTIGGTMMDVGVYGSNPNLTSGMTQ